MKKTLLILLILFFAFTNTIFAQYLGRNLPLNLSDPIVLDTAEISITYEFKYVPDSTKPNEKLKDIQTLLIGKSISKYFSQMYYDASLEAKNTYFRITKDPCGFEVYKNYPENKTTITQIGNSIIIGGDFLYEEKKPNFNWTIEQDTLTIASYLCQKATATFRGRVYTAWFTFDIPISNGPWKFSGLPGLILKAEDSKQHYVFECISIKNETEARPIEMYRHKYQRVTRKELMKIYDLLFNETEAFLYSVNPQLVNSNVPKLTYNPMEFE